MKLRKCLSDEEDWEESKGRLFRTIAQLCTIALQNKLESKAKCSGLKRECDVNGSLESFKELVCNTNDSQDVLKMGQQPGTCPENDQPHGVFAVHQTKW